MMISAILLSGGLGKRMQASTPKQYLPLHGKPVILHALDRLLEFPFHEIVIVCEESYQTVFLPYEDKARIHFASPGKERQDSVFSGLSKLCNKTELVCIHDGARPLLLKKDLFAVIEEGKEMGASALAIPVHVTIKEAGSNLVVEKTLDRSCLWALQTPQVLKYSILQEGYKKLQQTHQSLTDDVQLAETVNEKVKLVKGSESNIKITTSEDLIFAELLLKRLYG